MESTKTQQTVCAHQYAGAQIFLVQPKLKVPFLKLSVICSACSSCFNFLSGAEEFRA